MKKNLILYILLLAITLTAFAHKNKNNEGTKVGTQSAKPAKPIKKTKYLLRKLFSKDTLINYTYNNKNYLIEVKTYNRNKKLTETKTYTYNRKGEVITSESMDFMKNKKTKKEFSYVEGLASQEKKTANGKIKTTFYKYDDNKKLIEAKSNTSLSINTYDDWGNLTEQKMYLVDSSSKKRAIGYMANYSYDTLKNPFYTKSTMAESIVNFSPNNPTKIKFDIYNGFPLPTLSFCFIIDYEYNKDGYPTKATTKTTGIIEATKKEFKKTTTINYKYTKQ